ncbi:MAG: hypothetical protein V3V14_14830 [Saprospiraceae bacterium]
MKYIQYIIIALISIGTTSAQNVGDAVRYSDLSPIGTARTVGVGGSFGAMGGDFSVVGINPAGIAEYRIGEFTITPSIENAKSDAYFVADGSKSKRTNSSFLLDNISFIGATNPKESSWKTSNWAVGFSKLTSFSKNVSIAGETEGSITERFVERANGFTLENLDGFEAGPAYDAGAIFLDAGGNYVTDFKDDDNVTKSQSIDQNGSINELSISWAGNYDDKLNVGLSFGIPFVSYSETKRYNEGIVDGEFSNDLQYIENLTTSGVGANFKLGLQYKAYRQLRIGVALHSPSWYSLNDDYSTKLNYKYATAQENYNESGQSPDGSFKYGLTTPWKVVGSIGSIYKIGDIKGFVNADVEFLDYTNNEYDFTSNSNDPNEGAYAQEVNMNIDEQLGTATNYRLGTELAYNALRLRAGYTISTSAFISETKTNNSWSAGLGYRADKFFIDMAYKRSSVHQGYNPYVVLDQVDRDPLAIIDTNYGRMVATVGFKF